MVNRVSFRSFLFLVFSLLSQIAGAAFEPLSCQSFLFDPPSSDSSEFDVNYSAQRIMGRGFANLTPSEKSQNVVIAIGDSGVIPTSEDAFKNLGVEDFDGNACTGTDDGCHAAMVLSVFCSDGGCSMAPTSNTKILAHTEYTLDNTIYETLLKVRDYNKGKELKAQVRVLNLSLGTNLLHREKYRTVINDPAMKDVVITWSAGNEYGAEREYSTDILPSLANLTNVVPVSAVRATLQELEDFSNAGSWIKFTAWGSDVKTHRFWREGSGTSIAAPLVGGVFINVFKVAPSMPAKYAVPLVGLTALDLKDKEKYGYGLPNMVLATAAARAYEAGELVFDTSISNTRVAVKRALEDFFAAIVESFKNQSIAPRYIVALTPLKSAIENENHTYQKTLAASRNCSDYKDNLRLLMQRQFLRPSANNRGEICQFYDKHYQLHKPYSYSYSFEPPNHLIYDLQGFCERYSHSQLKRMQTFNRYEFLNALGSESGAKMPEFEKLIDGYILGSTMAYHVPELLRMKDVIAHKKWVTWVEQHMKTNSNTLRDVLSHPQAIAKAIKQNKFEDWVSDYAVNDLAYTNVSTRISLLGSKEPIVPYLFFSHPEAFSQSKLITELMPKYIVAFSSQVETYKPLLNPKALNEPWWLATLDEVIKTYPSSLPTEFLHVIGHPYLAMGNTEKWLEAIDHLIKKRKASGALTNFFELEDILLNEEILRAPKELHLLMKRFIDDPKFYATHLGVTFAEEFLLNEKLIKTPDYAALFAYAFHHGSPELNIALYDKFEFHPDLLTEYQIDKSIHKKMAVYRHIRGFKSLYSWPKLDGLKGLKPFVFEGAQMLNVIMPELIKLLADKNPLVQSRAIQLLSQCGSDGKVAIESLIHIIQNTKIESHIVLAIGALGHIGVADDKVIDLLAKLVTSDKNLTNRAKAIWALGEIGAGAKEAVPELMWALSNGITNLQYQSIIALGKLRSAAEPALPKLFTMANDDAVDAILQEQAKLAVAKIDPDASYFATQATVNKLSEQLALADIEQQYQALVALGRLQSKSAAAVPQITTFLTTTNSLKNKTIAAWALGQIGPAAKDSVLALVKLLASKISDVRYQAVMALGYIDYAARHAENALVTLIKKPDTNPVVIEKSLWALNRINSSHAYHPADINVFEMLKPLKASDIETRYQGIRALGASKTKASLIVHMLQQQLAADNLRVKISSIWALGELGEVSGVAVPSLVNGLSSAVSDVRYQTVIALGKIGIEATDALSPLEKIVSDTEESDSIITQAKLAIKQIKAL